MKLKSLVILMTAAMALYAAGNNNEGNNGTRSNPRLLNYQGYLTDTLSNPITDPSVPMVFAIFDAASSGNLKWNEIQGSVSVDKGIFHVLLGGVIPIPDSVFNAGIDRWLELTIAGQALSPRTRIVSVPYAYSATFADTALYAVNSASDIDWSFLISDAADTTLQMGGRWGIARFGNTMYGNADSTHVNLGVGSTTGTNGQNYKYITVGGGWTNSARNLGSTVGGGVGNIASNICATVGGGSSNEASGTYAAVTGGRYNKARGQYSVVSGGGAPNESDSSSAIGDYSVIGGGLRNRINGAYATIGGGFNNVANGYVGTVAGGSTNAASGYIATVGGGSENIASSFLATVGGGWSNTASDTNAIVGGGYYNYAGGKYSAILGGYADTITATGDYSYLFGINSNLTQDSTFMVDLPHVRFGKESGGYEFPTTDGSNGQVLVTNGSGQVSWVTTGDNDWTYRITDGADTTLQMGGRWGLARPGNVLIGNADSTHVNFGVACTTGYTGSNFKYNTIAGGLYNSAANRSTVAGGQYNAARGEYSTVGGGSYNIASGWTAAIAGGDHNTANNQYAFVGGGQSNAASGDGATVGGGMVDTVKAVYGAVFGGYSNLAGDALEDTCASVCGGKDNSANAKYSFIGGGQNNTAGYYYATVAGGMQNFANREYAFIGGGYSNEVTSAFATISGGYNNTAGGMYAVIGGGQNNNAGTHWATVGGGGENIASGVYTTVGGGRNNIASDSFNFIGGGYFNRTAGKYSAILGGYLDTIFATGNYSYLFGINSNLTQDSTFMVDMPHVWFGTEANGYEFPYGRGTDGQVMKTNGSGILSWSAIAYVDSARIAANAHKLQGKDTTDLNNSYVNEGQVNSIANAMIQDAAVTMPKISQAGATAGQVIKWNGTTWQPGADSSMDNDWSYRVTDGADTTLQMGGRWGIARAGNTMYGNADSTHVNLGVGSTTGTNGQNYKYSTVSGGYGNTASNERAIVGGGYNNTASGYNSTVAGGVLNVASNQYTTIGGGGNNLVSGYAATIGGGDHNRARGQWSVVSGGGSSNDADSNSAIGDYSAIGGGHSNIARGLTSIVGGGYYNITNNEYAAVGGGYHNVVSNNCGSIAGGYDNIVTGWIASVAGGSTNTVSGYIATIGGGSENVASGECATIAGGSLNTASNTNTAVGGGRFNRARGVYSVISGGGGGNEADSNSAIGDYSAIGGGYGNIARGNSAVIGGGRQNIASSWYSIVGGGQNNTASNQYTTVGGGEANIASGMRATVVGGSVNQAAGPYSSILGGFADTITATGDYSYLFGINSNLTQDSTFMVDLPHVWFGTEANGYEFPYGRGTDGQIMKTNGSGILSWGSITYIDSARVAANAHKLQGKDTTDLNNSYVNEGQVNSIANAMIQDAAVTMPKIAQAGATAGQVIKWNGTAWQPAADSSMDNDWSYRVTDGADTTLQMGGRWGIARAGNTMYGNADSTHVNLGVGSTTGTNGQNYKYITIGGGYSNTASYNWTTVGGGDRNTAGLSYATVGGGVQNNAGGQCATVSGGSTNVATSECATVAGGNVNTASNYNATVSGGQGNIASGYIATVGGGKVNRARGAFSVVSGGGGSNEADSNSARGDYSAIGGGRQNSAQNICSTVSGGWGNIANNDYTTLGGGGRNTASGYIATVSGGFSNTASDYVTTVGGGEDNRASNDYATVGGGWSNNASNQCATVGGGRLNTASGYSATVGGGWYNVNAGDYSAILGGYADTIFATGDYSYLFGIGSKLTQDSTFMVDLPHVWFGTEANGYEFPYGRGTDGQIMKTNGSGILSWGSITYIDSARVAANAHKLQGKDTTDLNNSYVNEGQVNSIANAMIQDAAVTMPKIAQAGAVAGQVIKWNGTAWQPGADSSMDNDWNYLVTDGADTTLQMGGRWGITRFGNTMYGNVDSTHVNLGLSSVTGRSGEDNRFCTVSGGGYNIANRDRATVSGGWYNTAGNYEATVGGGSNNNAGGNQSTIAGGAYNVATDDGGTIGGGYGNTAASGTGFYATVGGGQYNAAGGYMATIGGGENNTASGYMYATVGGGYRNTASGDRATVSGGMENLAAGAYSAILSGYADTITSTGSYSYLFGINSNLTQDSTFMVDLPHVWFGTEANGYEFPYGRGTDGQVMKTNGSGVLSWSTITYIDSARVAANTHKLQGKDTTDLNNSYVNEGQVNAIDSFMLQNNAVTMPKISQAGATAGQVIKWNGTTWQPGADISMDNDWSYRVTDGADTTLQTGGRWGIARFGNTMYGNADSTHVNLGVGSTTGTNGQNYKYSTVGGGYSNTASNSYSTVGGGTGNNASGTYATVAGGIQNTAANQYTTVGGGWQNSASYYMATVGGGFQNNASTNATVGGGVYNSASGLTATVSGGYQNTAGGSVATVGGGRYNKARGHYSVVSGGGSATEADSNSAISDYSAIGGGYHNIAVGNAAVIGGGYGNKTSVNAATIGGGGDNTANGDRATVGGGNANNAGNQFVTIGGGTGNNASGNTATVGGGNTNTASGEYATVGAGVGNTASGNFTVVGGGWSNTASGNGSNVTGGYYNNNAGDWSAILGGYADTIFATGDYSYLFGINSNLTQDSTFMVDLPHIRFGKESGGYEFPTIDGTNGQALVTNGSGQVSWGTPAALGWTISGNNMYSAVSGNVGIGTSSPAVRLEVRAGTSDTAAIFRGNLVIQSKATGNAVLELGEGLDYAEGFDVTQPDKIKPGTVLVIDPKSPGKLAVSSRAYDTKVAGIVAGGKGLGSGVRLGTGDFDHNVALAGRVYCNVDASTSAVEPGDLLTTANTPGYAMKAQNYDRAKGAVLGKAMERLEKGQKGQILVLVSLQ